MKSMYLKIAILILTLTHLCNGFSQTQEIAYKSHNGDMRFFKPDGTDNVGLPPMSIDTIIKVSDSVIIEISSIMGMMNKQTDTVTNHPYCANSEIPYDSMKQYFPRHTKFIGFDTTSIQHHKSSKVDTVQIIKEEKETIIPILNNKPNFNHSSPNHKNTTPIFNQVKPAPDYLVYLIVGLLLIIFGLMGIFWFKYKNQTIH